MPHAVDPLVHYDPVSGPKPYSVFLDAHGIDYASFPAVPNVHDQGGTPIWAFTRKPNPVAPMPIEALPPAGPVQLVIAPGTDFAGYHDNPCTGPTCWNPGMLGLLTMDELAMPTAHGHYPIAYNPYYESYPTSYTPPSPATGHRPTHAELLAARSNPGFYDRFHDPKGVVGWPTTPGTVQFNPDPYWPDWHCGISEAYACGLADAKAGRAPCTAPEHCEAAHYFPAAYEQGYDHGMGRPNPLTVKEQMAVRTSARAADLERRGANMRNDLQLAAHYGGREQALFEVAREYGPGSNPKGKAGARYEFYDAKGTLVGSVPRLTRAILGEAWTHTHYSNQSVTVVDTRTGTRALLPPSIYGYKPAAVKAVLEGRARRVVGPDLPRHLNPHLKVGDRLRNQLPDGSAALPDMGKVLTVRRVEPTRAYWTFEDMDRGEPTIGWVTLGDGKWEVDVGLQWAHQALRPVGRKKGRKPAPKRGAKKKNAPRAAACNPTPKARAFISAEIRRQVKKGKPQKQAIRIAHEVARKKGYRSVPAAPRRPNPTHYPSPAAKRVATALSRSRAKTPAQVQKVVGRVLARRPNKK